MARPDLHDRIAALRKLRVAQDRVRVRRVVSRRDGVRAELDGRWLLAFGGNDYLGLSQQFQVTTTLQDAAGRDGFGAGGPPGLGGHHAAHAALEQELAEWLERPAALLFGSGFLANLAVQQALLGEDGDVCVQDRLNHPRLLDASRLAGCRLRRYPHADAEGAIRQLRSEGAGAAMLATDGVFGMEGDVAPLRALALVARVQKALLYVDDAHGVGVRGPQGRGSVAEARLGVEEAPLQLVSLGHALGGHGAAVVGDAALIQHLAETARPYLHGSALPPALAAASSEALRHARRDEWRREKLAGLVDRFRTRALASGLELMASDTPIQPVLCGAEGVALAWSAALEAAGYWVPVIRPPSVPEGTARLRVTLSALHTPEQVDGLVDALAEVQALPALVDHVA